jgi:hypothetical protein
LRARFSAASRCSVHWIRAQTITSVFVGQIF